MEPHKDRRLVALATLLTIGGCTTTGADPAESTAKPNPPTPVVTTAPDNEHGIDDHDLTTPPPTDQATRVAEAFADAWVDTAGGGDAWRNALQPWCDPGLGQALNTADPGYISARRVIGPPTLTPVDNQQWLRAEIPTDTGTLLLTIAPIGDRWLVSDIDFRRSTQ